VDDELRPAGGAGRAEDTGDVGGIVALRQTLRRVATPESPEKIIIRIGVGKVAAVAAETDERLAGEQGVAVELLVHQDKHGGDRAREGGDQRRVELDIERGDDRAQAPGGQPEQEVFEVLVGEKEHTARFADAARLERRGDIDDRPIELTKADRGVLVEIDDRELVGIALAVSGEEIGDRSIGYLRPMWAEHVTHGVSLAVFLSRVSWPARARHHAT